MAEDHGTESTRYAILVVDDEELVRNLVVTVLSKLGHSCVTASDGVEALNKLRENNFDAVITDIEMPNMDGIILTREISKHHPSIPVMVMTTYDEEEAIGNAISVGAREFIKKPFSSYEFAIRLHKMINDFGSQRGPGSAKDGEEDAGKDIQELKDDLAVALEKS